MIPNSPKAAAPSSLDFDLGTWLGRRQAFGLMPGKASAADAECLRTIRDQKLYKGKTGSFDEFCSRHLGTSRTQVNKMIRDLEEFGPEFFEITQLTRISPETYRTIASHISALGLLLDGEVIPLSQENSERIAAAVAELRRRAMPEARETAPGVTRYADVEKLLDDVIERIKTMRHLDAKQKLRLADRMARMAESVTALGLE